MIDHLKIKVEKATGVDKIREIDEDATGGNNTREIEKENHQSPVIDISENNNRRIDEPPITGNIDKNTASNSKEKTGPSQENNSEQRGNKQNKQGSTSEQEGKETTLPEDNKQDKDEPVGDGKDEGNDTEGEDDLIDGFPIISFPKIKNDIVNIGLQLDQLTETINIGSLLVEQDPDNVYKFVDTGDRYNHKPNRYKAKNDGYITTIFAE